MRRALRQPSNRLWTEILAPSLLLDVGGHHHNHHNHMDVVAACALPLHMRPIYLPIADTVRTKGRNHKLAIWASEAEPAAVQGEISVFGNVFRIGSRNEDGEWGPPSRRVVGAPETTFT